MAGHAESRQIDPEISDLRRQFTEIEADAARLLEGLSHEQFNWRPSPERWSIAQCLAHLSLVDGKVIEQIEPAITKARISGPFGLGSFRYSALSWWLIRRVEPRPKLKLKLKSPEAFVPAPVHDLANVANEFQRVQGRLSELAAASNGLDLARVKVATPMATWIHMSLGQRFRLTAAHDRRHLHQAWQVRNELP